MWTKRLTIITSLIMLVSIISAGGGHGTQVPTALCYPILFCFRVFESGGGPLLWVVLLGQFPMYGLLIVLGNRKRRQLLIAGLVVILHVSLVIIVLRGYEF